MATESKNDPLLRRPDPSSLSGRRVRWWPWVALALGVAILLMRSPQSGTRIAYSDLKAKIAAGEVGEVQLGRERIVATPRAAAGATATGTAPGDGQGQGKPIRWVSTRVEDDPTLIPLLEQHGVKYTGVVESDWLSNLFLAWVLPLGLLALFWMLLLRRMRPGAGIMSIGRSRARLVPEEGTGVTFADVAGVDEAVEELREVVDFLASPERFRRIGGRIPKGVLLVGPPGTGKTLLARAVAGEARTPFFSLTGSDFVEMFVGVGAARVRDLFQQAQAKAPCIIFIDELDAIGKVRGAGPFASHDEREQTLNQLLSEMDGFDARKGLIIMAATNRPEILDPALMRPGRFDRQVVIDRPDVVGREAILRVHAKQVKLAEHVDLRAIAAITSGFAGAELANLINEAALLAARRDKNVVEMAELNEAVERVVAGLQKKNRRINPREKDIVAHHEAGHALLAEVLPTTDRVHKVSMIPRGLGALGFTMQLPLEDRYVLTRAELFDKITVLLGGQVAERLSFGEISTGAQDDLLRASDLARRMVVQFGMSDELGPQALSDREAGTNGMDPRSWRLFGLTDRSYSERTMERIDAEAESILRRAQARAHRVLLANQEYLELLAVRLRDREVLEGAELRDVLTGAALPSDEGGPTLRH